MNLTTFYVRTDLIKNQIVEVSSSPEILAKRGGIFTCRAKTADDAMRQIAKARLLSPSEEYLKALEPS